MKFEDIKKDINEILVNCFMVALSRVGGYADPQKVKEEFSKEFNFSFIFKIAEYLTKSKE